MLLLRQSLLVACLLMMGLALGCSSKPQPMKDGTPGSTGSEATKPIPVNPRNPKKVLPTEPEPPPAPPIKK